MKFASLHNALLLWVVPVSIVLFVLFARLRRRAMERFASVETLSAITRTRRDAAYAIRSVLIVLTLILLVLSLMRPQWGFKWEKIKRSGLDIVIALDVSKSMMAEDIKPSRLERSKLAVKDLITHLAGDRVGLIAFSGSAFLQSPLTSDYRGFMIALDALQPGIIPRGGTSLTTAIDEATSAFSSRDIKHKILIVISDGEDQEESTSEILKKAEEAKKDGVTIYAVGIGTPEGELIPLRDERGGMTFLKDSQGNVVKSRLNESLLRDVATRTGGSYVRATPSAFGLDVLYDRRLSSLERREFEEERIKRYTERFQLPLAAALLLLMLEPFIRIRRRNGDA